MAADDDAAPAVQTLEEVKANGLLRSSYRKQIPQPETNAAPQPNLDVYREEIGPVLTMACVQCHGPKTQEGEFRVDTLDPDLLHGDDVDWWLEIVDVLSNGEMPPEGEGELADKDRSKVIEWLSAEIQVASAVRRAEEGHSSFRRMTRYEYNYALQDLLGLPYDFAKDLPPEPTSPDGFQNSSEMLQMSAVQLGYYRDVSRNALRKATVRGERPAPMYWGVSMEAASARMWTKVERDVEKIQQKNRNEPEKLKRELARHAARLLSKPRGAHFMNLTTGQAVQASWSYRGASYAWKPTATRPEVAENSPIVAVLPVNQKLTIELGNTVPDTGTLRIRIRACRTSVVENRFPSLSLEFGWQASNNSHASVTVGDRNVAIDAPPDDPQFYQWDIPLSEIYPRNPMRKTAKIGATPSPSEYVRLHNSSISQGDIQIDYVEVTAPVYDQWPPDSHTRIFIDGPSTADEMQYAREVLTRFMSRAWRRPVTAAEVDQKLALLAEIQPLSDSVQEALIEVLATVLCSPKFLYLVQADPPPGQSGRSLTDFELATRLSMFLWCSTPDEELLELAATGRLNKEDILIGQTKRMLADRKSRRFSKHFVRQWLGMQLLEFLSVDKQTYPQFDSDLKAAMQEEPVAFFYEVLQHNHSVMDFIHADYTLAMSVWPDTTVSATSTGTPFGRSR